MKILVTGCAGLIGANYSRHCLNNDHKIIGIDNLSGGYKEFLPTHENFVFYEVDLIDEAALSDIFIKEKPDIVYHFAAYAAEGLSPFIRNFNYKNNVLCSMNVINECIKHDCKIVFTSSMAVYGDQTPPFSEDMIAKPIDPYGIAKNAVEMDIKLAGDQFGLRHTIIRPHNIIGKYQNIWDKYRNVVGIFIRKAINNQPITIYGDGNQTRAFSDIQYYMSAFDAVSDNFDKETFNIGADKYFSLNYIADIVCSCAKLHDIKTTIEHSEPRHEAKHAYCDHSKAKIKLGFEDSTNVENLVCSMFNWAIAEPNRPVVKMKYEIEKNIYSYWK
jgi:UDP-glucose 4-epimerase